MGSPPAHNCRYILVPQYYGGSAIYCEKPVRYKIVVDDDGNRKRKYNSFCDDHDLKVLEDDFWFEE